MRMRMPRLLVRRPRPAALLAAGLTTAALGTLAAIGNVYDGQNAGVTFGTPGCSVSIEWRGDPGLFGSCTGTDPDAKVVTAYNDGWIDGQADLRDASNRYGSRR
ncbi:hypothetical protein [Streptomyces noursei]|uniref:hypothetical protein n=1 Tax=Streptomyces noursei TaxID=1971 RepID=UPI0016732700|nr:hypothetical protein [Streptomyces noursei]MCZ1014399.1 hypothetical protein [Streptomyces noursei]GGW94723.1 hypothetical protein GCM10010341_14850 [Streptomyces noursei]